MSEFSNFQDAELIFPVIEHDAVAIKNQLVSKCLPSLISPCLRWDFLLFLSRSADRQNKTHTYFLNALGKLCRIRSKLLGHAGLLCSFVDSMGESCVVVRFLSKIGYKYFPTIDPVAVRSCGHITRTTRSDFPFEHPPSPDV